MQASLILGILSLVFIIFATKKYLQDGRKMSIPTRVWYRIAMIFAAVSLLLLVML